ncbi:MAG: MFS transporter [Planctomycetota bacterium]|nr:MFS transporter [Planctomycetota bacterium]
MSKALDNSAISVSGRRIILIVAFLGWGFAGVHMSINGIVMRVATANLMTGDFAASGIAVDSEAVTADAKLVAGFDENGSGMLEQAERARAREAILGQWFGWFTCAFLFGAAAGGYLFGYVGDAFGRAKAMAASILCYSIFSLVSIYVHSPGQLLVLRFLTCLGIGGMWPNGIALLSEAWSSVSRPLIAGVMGTAANVGILIFALYTVLGHEVTALDWRWTFYVGAAPIVLGVLAIFLVPESPSWLAIKRGEVAEGDRPAPKAGLGEIFKPPILKTTIIGILLGTIPLFGGWGVSNWATAWASEVGDTAKHSAPVDADKADGEKAAAKPETKQADPVLKSMTVVARSLPGSVSSLLGGALAFWLGRKRTYFLLCIGSLVCTHFLFRVDNPADSHVLFTISSFGRDLEITEFLGWQFGLGFFSGFFFGWLPLCLPEMFPTRVRSTGAGVSFNWGRILTAFGVLLSAAALKDMFQGEYATVGQITGLIYAVGLVVIFFAPDTSDKSLEE